MTGLKIDLLDVPAAAERLGVSPRRVRALVEAGDLAAAKISGRLLIHPLSVQRRLDLAAGRGRPLSPSGAWALLLSNLATEHWRAVGEQLGLSPQRRSNLRSLARAHPPEDWRRLARRRADVHRFNVRDSFLARLQREPGLTLGGVSASDSYGLDLVATDELEIYVGMDVLNHLRRKYRLHGTGRQNMVVRTPRIDPTTVLAGRSVMPIAVVAVDLLESGDPRSRRSGLAVLRDLRDQLPRELA